MKEELKQKSQLYKIRHSLAHILAQAVQVIRPGSKLGFGPPIENGLYYDFILSSPITEEDFPAIEKKMKEIIKARQQFSYEDLPYDQAMEKLDSMGEPYKKEYAKELFQKNNLEFLRFYTNGPFLDMCEGPHIDDTRQIPKGCFKIKSVAGAYWRGDSNNTMMTRIYMWAYETKEELQAAMKQYEEAQKRDHKKLGNELDLFFFSDDVGKGLPLWTPAGTVLRDEIEKYMKELEFQDGYHRVTTPHLAKQQLYLRTGHLPYYEEDMYPPMCTGAGEEHEEKYFLRPMNCPHHHLIFANRKKSYRDLPYRLAEYGQVYRHEDSGSLSGLLRVRGMCQNDAHVYCREDQIQEEFLKVMNQHKTLYTKLGLNDYHMRFSTWDPEDPKGKNKFVDNPAAWDKTQKYILEAMKASGLKYIEGKGEAAFYGPKIDFQIKTVTGREETASTNQLDFAVPQRLNLTYTNEQNQEVHPYIIHRAPGGTHERFIAFLIEHYAGAFPFWLAPNQVRIVPVSNNYYDYAKVVESQIRSKFIRCDSDISEHSFNKKIRNNTKLKIPVLLIVGENEKSENSVTLRCYGERQQVTLPLDAFISKACKLISERNSDNTSLLS